VNIGFAVAHIKISGKPIKRDAWPAGTWLECQKPDANSKMTLPYAVLVSGDDRVPWLPTQIDLLAEDYEFA
jgi:hypothetical protein